MERVPAVVPLPSGPEPARIRLAGIPALLPAQAVRWLALDLCRRVPAARTRPGAPRSAPMAARPNVAESSRLHRLRRRGLLDRRSGFRLRHEAQGCRWRWCFARVGCLDDLVADGRAVLIASGRRRRGGRLRGWWRRGVFELVDRQRQHPLQQGVELVELLPGRLRRLRRTGRLRRGHCGPPLSHFSFPLAAPAAGALP
jgi:hypothetical protein